MSETLASALVAAQQKMPAVAKDTQAVYGKYMTLDSIIAKTRPILNEHGLSIIQMPVALDNGAPGLKTTILHVSGESVSSTMPLLLGKQDMQQLGSAITYARRYAWAAALGIASEHDDDAQGLVAEPKGGQSDAMREQPNGPSRPVSQASADTDEPASPTSTFRVPDGVQAELNQRVEPADGGKPGEVVVEFGKHKGKKLSDCPRNYVEWLASTSFEPTAASGRRVKAAAVMVLEAA